MDHHAEHLQRPAGAAGHGPSRHDGHDAHDGHDRHAGHSPEMFRDRLWVSLLLTGPILYFSEQIQDWLGYEAVSFPGDGWVTPLLATVLFFYAGIVFLRGGVAELRARTPGMMTLISIAITVAYGYSLAVSLGLDGDDFYWELATLLDVMLLGHWMEMRSIQSASRALEHLADMVPTIAHRVASDGSVEDVSVAYVTDGDTILIRPGEQAPVDGDVVEGASSMNEAFLTGESRPVNKQQGDEVVAGAVNGEGALTVTVTRTGEATTLSQIMRLVEEAQASRSRFQVLADRAAYWLVMIAVAVSVPTLVGWALLGASGITFAVARAVTVLVIACPHALGLAIPLVNMNATSISARNGILVRNREAFERGWNVRFVALDKTGTLTEGRFVVAQVTADGLGEAEALMLAAGVERASEHPLATAIVDAATERGLTVAHGSDVTAVPGHGLEGKIDGRLVRVGRPEWAADLGVEVAPTLLEALKRADQRGESAVAVLDDRRAVAVLALADKIRDTAADTIGRLRELGVTPVMITGDAEAVAATVAGELGIDRYHARVLPQDKARIVRELKHEGATAFVGDGINDAPALLEADLGVAIGAGTNVATVVADLVLVEDDPADVARALTLSRATHRKMVQNLAWATGYNTVAIPLAAGVAAGIGIVLNPAIGALFMSLSTIIVAANAMMLRRVQLV
ncbi:MAG: heavy metal translocating P-type ATPase [Acidimicrobiia bacterium]